MPATREAPSIRHRDGCPKKRELEGDTVETYATTAPDGATVLVTRCVECGEHTTQKEK